MSAKVCYALLLSLILVCVAHAIPQDQGSAALTGEVTSDAEGRMEGVLVTATPDGGNVAITVATDEKGHYSFPASKLQPGSYALTIRAAGYDLSGPTTAKVEAGKSGQTNIKLVKTKDLASQLTAGEWLMSVPGTEKQKKVLFHCDACHSLDVVVKSDYDTAGFLTLLPKMQNYWLGNSTFSHPVAPPKSRILIKDWPVETELAKYLSSINLSGGKTTWPYQLKTYPRPKGENTKVIITEYILPRAGSTPHDVALDPQGQIWYSNFQTPYIGRLDPATGKVKEWKLPQLKPELPDQPQLSLTIETDKDGNPWLPRFYQGCAVTMLDVKTDQFHTYKAPAQYNDPTAYCPQGNVGPNGMVWFNDLHAGMMFELDTKTGKVRPFEAFPNSEKHSGPPLQDSAQIDEKARKLGHEMYGSVVQANGDPIYCDSEGSNIAVMDHNTGKVELYPTPTPNAFPRRGGIDPKGRFWFGEWQANQLGMFDPETKKITEYGPPPVPWSGLYRAIADKNGEAWTGGMTTDFVYRFNSKTGQWREYLVPFLGGEMRDVKIDYSGGKEKIWIPLVHGRRIMKIEPLD
jgi:virginiamycin B lyase